MQNCMIVGNVARINKVPGTNKAYVVIADHKSVKGEDGKFKQEPNYITLEGFIPEGLNIEVGMLIGAQFEVRSYKTRDGKETKQANDVIRWDVTLRSPSKKGASAPEAAAQAAAEAAADVPEGAGEPAVQ